jgi:hypothetical protein
MIDKVIPFSMMFDFVFGIILLIAVLTRASDINVLVKGFAQALSVGVTAVK